MTSSENPRHQWLDSLKVGDTVAMKILQNWKADPPYLLYTILRVTKTQFVGNIVGRTIIVSEVLFKRENGNRVGHPGCIEPVTQEVLEAIDLHAQRERLRERLMHVRPEHLDFQQVVTLLAAIKEVCP